MHPQQHVAVLLTLYCPGQYLTEQLSSLYAQTHKNISLWISCDGAADQSDLDGYFKKETSGLACSFPVHLHQGPNQGFVANFLSLVCNPEIEADYFAFCDQDDLWHKDKIEHAIKYLQRFPDDKPGLYCGRTRLVDGEDNFKGYSPLFTRPPGFKNALVQNIGGGNTMVFNRKARNLLRDIGPVEVASHDWWAYMVVSGCGGNVVYDPLPKIDYRQHGQNMVGANVGWKARFIRFRQMLSGRFEKWGDLHMEALDKIKSRLTLENQNIFEKYKATRRQDTVLARLKNVRKSGVYRQTKLGNIGLYIATLLKKL